MARTILIITGDAGESFETLYARQRLTEAGFTPRIAAPSKRRLNLVIHDYWPSEQNEIMGLTFNPIQTPGKSSSRHATTPMLASPAVKTRPAAGPGSK